MADKKVDEILRKYSQKIEREIKEDKAINPQIIPGAGGNVGEVRREPISKVPVATSKVSVCGRSRVRAFKTVFFSRLSIIVDIFGPNLSSLN